MNNTQAPSRNFDVIVVGGGMAGISIAYELSAQNSVAVVEMESTLAFHSTGRSAASFLESYGNRTVRMLTAGSREFFEDKDAQFDTPVATPLELLMIADGSEVDGLRALHGEVSALSDGIELLDEQEARTLNPTLRPGYTQLAMIDRTAMELDVHALHQWYLRGFRKRGGEVFRSAGIVDGRRTGSSWVLHDNSGETYSAATVVNAAGAWCDQVAQALGAPPVGITPLRRTAFMVPAPAPSHHDAPLPITMGASENFYFKPDGAQFLCSPADESLQTPGDARPDELEIARAIELINEASILDIRTVASSWAGLRSFVADRTPVVGADPAAEGFFWYAGQGGYGIQMAPALARLGAALATDGVIPPDLARLGVTAEMVAPGRPALTSVVGG